jgi:hypothetical protein
MPHVYRDELYTAFLRPPEACLAVTMLKLFMYKDMSHNSSMKGDKDDENKVPKRKGKTKRT